MQHYKYSIECSFLEGKAFGTFFRLKDAQTNELEVLEKFEEIGILETFYAGEETEQDVHQEEELDNRNIEVNQHHAQKTSQQEIEQMKATGTSGDAIIQNLIDNSETFQQRTKFSKEKYLRKKRQKYTFYFEARFPSMADLCDCFS